MLLDVADAQDVVQDQAVIAHVGIHRDHSDQLRSHLGVGSNPFEGERQDGDLGPGWVSPPLHPDGFSSEHLGLQVSPRHSLPAVYSDLVNWGDWSLMSSRKIRTS